jgi:hypothetical protein
VVTLARESNSMMIARKGWMLLVAWQMPRRKESRRDGSVRLRGIAAGQEVACLGLAVGKRRLNLNDCQEVEV